MTWDVDSKPSSRSTDRADIGDGMSLDRLGSPCNEVAVDESDYRQSPARLIDDAINHRQPGDAVVSLLRVQTDAEVRPSPRTQTRQAKGPLRALTVTRMVSERSDYSDIHDVVQIRGTFECISEFASRTPMLGHISADVAVADRGSGAVTMQRLRALTSDDDFSNVKPKLVLAVGTSGQSLIDFSFVRIDVRRQQSVQSLVRYILDHPRVPGPGNGYSKLILSSNIDEVALGLSRLNWDPQAKVADVLLAARIAEPGNDFLYPYPDVAALFLYRIPSLQNEREVREVAEVWKAFLDEAPQDRQVALFEVANRVLAESKNPYSQPSLSLHRDALIGGVQETDRRRAASATWRPLVDLYRVFIEHVGSTRRDGGTERERPG